MGSSVPGAVNLHPQPISAAQHRSSYGIQGHRSGHSSTLPLAKEGCNVHSCYRFGYGFHEETSSHITGRNRGEVHMWTVYSHTLGSPIHSPALQSYGTPVLYRCSAYGSAGYRPPGIPVLVGSDTFGRVQSGIPTQRPGPETRNTVILGCSTSKSELSIAVCQPVSRGCYASRTGYGGPGLKWSRLTSAMDEEPTRCMLLSRG